MFTVLLTALASLLWLAIMFIPLERAFPAREGQRFFRAGFITDLAFFFGQHLAFGAIAVHLLTLGTSPLDLTEAAGGILGSYKALPFWVQIVIAIMLGDLAAYWGHRLQHRVEFLWRFHSIHHSNTEIDWLAAHREHPLDGLYTQFWVNLPAILLGFDLQSALGLVAFRSLWAIFIHSNVKLPLGPLHYMVGSPALHHWHHALDRDTGNYANLAPWLDLLFGTYHCPDHEPEALGVGEPMPESYLGLLLHPFIPNAAREATHEDLLAATDETDKDPLAKPNALSDNLPQPSTRGAASQ